MDWSAADSRYFCNCLKWRVYWRLNYDFITGIRKCSNCIHQNGSTPLEYFTHSGSTSHPNRTFPIWQPLSRIQNSLPGNQSMDVPPSFELPLQFLPVLQIGIGNPHGNDILRIGRLIFFTLRHSSVNQFIKIMFHRFLLFIRTLPVLSREDHITYRQGFHLSLKNYKYNI